MFKKMTSLPFVVWLIAGTVIPMCTIIYYGMTTDQGSFTFENFLSMFSKVHFKALLMSLSLAAISTLICLILAFPLALILRNKGASEKGFIIFIFILPMWMNFLLRTMAWQVILERNGIIASLVTSLHLPFLPIINTPVAIVLGMVYDFLPFMVLPIFNNISKIDEMIIEAAYDLGATRGKVLKSIILPLSIPGIVSGITMVFVPSVTTFVISNILGGGKIYLIGNIIDQEFTSSSNWNLGSGLSLFMMIFVVATMALMSKFDKNGEGNLI